MKELGTWAAENLDAIPQKVPGGFTAAEAIGAGRFIYESDAISSQVLIQWPGKPGKN